MKNSITALIPSFNRAHTLKRAIDSVLNQTILPSELIVIDDGSTDLTTDLLKSYSPEHVTMITQANRGVSSARNAGIRAAQGDWIALLDSDDVWHPQKLEHQIRYINTYSECKILQTQEKWIRNGVFVNAKNKHRKPSGWIFDDCLEMCMVSPSSVIIHKSIFDHVGLFDEQLPACEDYDLWLRIALHYPVGLLDEVLITKYGGHEDQLSRIIWGLDRFRIKALEKILQNEELSKKQFERVKDVLLQKIQIMISGLEKRGKVEDVEKYRAKALTLPDHRF